MIRNINSLIGYKIHATDGELGKVDEFYFDNKSWNIRYMVVETGNWLLGRKVLISPAALKTPDWTSKVFPVALTREQVRNSPDIDTKKTVSRLHEIELQKHYTWPVYWDGAMNPGGMHGGVPFPALREETDKAEEEAPAQRAQEDPYLRGTRAVTGYRIHAMDGPIGHVEDYLVDDKNWNIRFLVVDIGVWLPGRKVLVSPDRIKSVNWGVSEVFTDLSRAAISTSPEFDPSKLLSEDYAGVLFRHYGKLMAAGESELKVVSPIGRKN
jgi:sporulation protein YlmC with PRC-barrel domain